jgi:hypothetical protein
LSLTTESVVEEPFVDVFCPPLEALEEVKLAELSTDGDIVPEIPEVDEIFAVELPCSAPVEPAMLV